MSYTKGPYNAYIEEGLPILISGKDDLGSAAEGFDPLHIATIHTKSGSVELPVEANARLFKAAPDLLVMLKRLSVYLSSGESLVDIIHDANRVITQVEEGE